MKKRTAFSPGHDDRILLPTAKAAREVEFDHLMLRIYNNIGGCSTAFREDVTNLGHGLRSGIYPTAVDAFIEAAEYLKKYKNIMIGNERDPEDGEDQ